MDPSGPRFDRPVLWTVINSHGLNGCLVSALKQHRSTVFSPPYTASFHLFFLTLSQKSLLASSSILILSITLSSLPLSLVFIALLQLNLDFFLNPLSLNHSLISPSSLSHYRSSAQISSSLSHSLNHSLVSASLPPRRRSSAQIAAHSLTLISASLPRPCCSSLCASSPSPSFGTLLHLICFFFVNICKLIVDDDIDLKCCV